jgi:tetratricopeptide (TPR) repeat protein
LACLSAVTLLPLAATHASPEKARRLHVEAVVAPRVNVRSLSDERLAALRAAVAAAPRRRKARLDLVRALTEVERLDEARREALAWREHDAYNLVAVRLLGDIESARGDKQGARRIFSSIVELLPRDVEARRALATVLKQAGDLEGAGQQLAQALALRPEDRRIAFELGDVEQRLGLLVAARARFESTAQAADADESLRYPARQRLARIVAAERRAAWLAHDEGTAAAREAELRALGLEGDNDLTVFLSWDSDRTDVDLWVLTPTGEKVFYAHARGHGGETLYHDVTTGYGPESFTVQHAARGQYRIFVNYYGARPGDFKEARGEVLVVTHEGRPDEHESTFPYRLFEHGETVEVARVWVAGGAS